MAPTTLLYFAVLPFLVSAVTTFAVERACVKLGVFDLPGERKMHRIPVPRMGGLAFTLTALFFGFAIPGAAPSIQLWAAMLVFVGGFFDDLRLTNSVLGKLLFQIPAALLFAAFCDLSPLHFDIFPSFLVRWLIFAFLFFMTNAANLMDNMNGLAAGLNIAIHWTIAVLSFFYLGDLSFALQGLLVGACILGFCVRNFPLGKIYMGDQGSQLLGFFAASYAILFWLRMMEHHAQLEFWQGVLFLIPLFFLFLYDVTSVVIIRVSEGRSPLVGDQCHLSHRIMKSGTTATGAVLLLIASQLVLVLLSGLLVYLWLR